MLDEIKSLVKAKSNLVWIEKFPTYCFSNLGTFWLLFSSQAPLWDETSYAPESLTKADVMVIFIKNTVGGGTISRFYTVGDLLDSSLRMWEIHIKSIQ